MCVARKKASGVRLTAGTLGSRAAIAPRSIAKIASVSAPASTSGWSVTMSVQGRSAIMFMGFLLLSSVAEQAVGDQCAPVCYQFGERGLLRCGGGNQVAGSFRLRALETGPGERLSQQAQPLAVGMGFVEELLEFARLILHQPESTVQHVNQRRGCAVRRRQSQFLVLAALRVVEQAVLALRLLHQGAAARRQPTRAVQFDVLRVGEDDGLARVQFAAPVGVAPESVESAGPSTAATPERGTLNIFSSSVSSTTPSTSARNFSAGTSSPLAYSTEA